MAFLRGFYLAFDQAWRSRRGASSFGSRLMSRSVPAQTATTGRALPRRRHKAAGLACNDLVLEKLTYSGGAMPTQQEISTHYTHGNLVAAIRSGVESLGKTIDSVTVEDRKSTRLNS